MRRDALGEFLRGCGIGKLNLAELRSALNEMHVRVVKSGQQQLAAGVDYSRLRPAPQINLRARAHGNDAITDDSDCFGLRMVFIHGVNGSVGHNQRCRRFRLRVRVQSGHNYQEAKSEFTFHNRVMNPETFAWVEICWVIS